ncbi:MAG: tetratricopeptide repeat protein [Pirellulaceae bacterium]|nr:tetratricopeptide repeat protein [Planctomycetales bacterium]
MPGKPEMLAIVLILALLSGCSTLVNFAPQASERSIQDQLELKLGMAQMAERNGALADARQAYEEIVASNPANVLALHRLGVVAVKQGDLERAIDYLQRAVALGTPSAELMSDLGYAHLLRGELNDAAAMLSHAAELDPDNGRIVNNLALVAGYQGRLDECLALFRRVNSEAESLANLGFVLSQLGDLEGAKRHFLRALDLDPSLKAAANGLYYVEQGTRGDPNRSGGRLELRR